MKTQLSVCGVNCSTDCRAYEEDCAGCNELQGRVSWAYFYERERCPIYECAEEKGLASCGDCCYAPCHVWMDTRNPDVTDEEFQADINKRLSNLEKRELEKE